MRKSYSYIKFDEIKNFVASIKGNTILVPILLELANYNFPDFDRKQLTAHLNLSVDDVKELTKAYEQDNETYKKYKTSDRSSLDAMYLLWLLFAIDKNQDLIVFAH